MSNSERGQELIQKYLEALASEAEIAELEGLLATDPEVAAGFAAAARLEAGLAGYFRQQYKIDQVAALLNAPEAPATPATGAAAEKTGDPGEPRLPPGSTFTPRLDRMAEARRVTGRKPRSESPRWKSIAAAALVLIMGSVAVWSIKHGGEEPFRLVSGRLTVAGREVTAIPENAIFEAAGDDAAIIELANSVHIELAALTRATINRKSGRPVMVVKSGGGDFHVSRNPSDFRVETTFGVVTSEGGRFSLKIVEGRPGPSSQPASIPLPSLTVVVAEGSVTVEHGGISTRLKAGQQRTFFSPT